jgi:hypothetical protein
MAAACPPRFQVQGLHARAKLALHCAPPSPQVYMYARLGVTHAVLLLRTDAADHVECR